MPDSRTQVSDREGEDLDVGATWVDLLAALEREANAAARLYPAVDGHPAPPPSPQDLQVLQTRVDAVGARGLSEAVQRWIAAIQDLGQSSRRLDTLRHDHHAFPGPEPRKAFGDALGQAVRGFARSRDALTAAADSVRTEAARELGRRLRVADRAAGERS